MRNISLRRTAASPLHQSRAKLVVTQVIIGSSACPAADLGCWPVSGVLRLTAREVLAYE